MANDEKTADGTNRNVRTTQATDFAGKHDPDNPRNFTLTRRIFSTLAVTFLAFVSTFAASIYSAGIKNVTAEFHVSEEVAILPLSLYNLGLAFGPLIGAPLSETAGRKVVILTTTPIFALFILGAGLSQNIVALTVCRFFAGVLAAPAIGNASATITDYTAGRYRAISMAFYYSIPFFGAVLGPLVGGFVTEAKGWRWTQWTTLFFIAAFYVPILFTKETYKKTILQRRAKKLGVPGPPTVTRTVPESVRYFTTTLLVRPVHMLLTEPIVTLLCIYNGFLFGLMYTFVVASPWIYQTYYGFSITGQSLSFLGIIIGTFCAPYPLIVVDHFLYQPRLKQFYETHDADERFPPEYRLFPSLIASFMMPACLFAFAWTARPSIHWICPEIFQCLALLTTVMVYSSANLFMIDVRCRLLALSPTLTSNSLMGRCMAPPQLALRCSHVTHYQLSFLSSAYRCIERWVWAGQLAC